MNFNPLYDFKQPINEYYNLETDFLKVMGETVRPRNMRNILIPQIGDNIYYDRQSKVVQVVDWKDDSYRNKSQYIPIGTIVKMSEDKLKLTLVTPYYVQCLVNMNDKNKDEDLIKQMKSFVRDYTKEVKEQIGDDIKFSVPSESDMEILSGDIRPILNGLESISSCQSMRVNAQTLDNIIKFDLIGFTRKVRKND